MEIDSFDSTPGGHLRNCSFLHHLSFNQVRSSVQMKSHLPVGAGLGFRKAFFELQKFHKICNLIINLRPLY